MAEMIRVGNVEVKATDCWRTPTDLFRMLDEEFHFWLDAAARKDDTHCICYLGPDNVDPKNRDALAVDWGDLALGSIFVNPPYSPAGGGLLNWIRQCVNAGVTLTVVALVPCTPSTEWFRLAHGSAAELRLFPRRINCDKPDGSPSSSARGDLCLFVWRPYAHPCKVSYFDNDPAETLRELGATEDSLPW